MVFINIYSYDPDKRDKIIARRLEKGLMFPKGIKVLHEWSTIGGGGGVIVCETDDPKALAQASLAWSDLLKSDIFPVLNTEEVLSLSKK
jgi:uncharacterized protein with GYD domain